MSDQVATNVYVGKILHRSRVLDPRNEALDKVRFRVTQIDLALFESEPDQRLINQMVLEAIDFLRGVIRHD